jgi:polar amino acid transport system permease protein
MNWTRQHPGWAMFAAMIGLLVFSGDGGAARGGTGADRTGRRAVRRRGQITVGLTLIAGSAGVVIGVLAGLGKLSRFWPLRWLCDSYVWLIRGTPLLLQILFVWLAFPMIMPEGIELSDFACAAIALSLNIGAYNTECVRAGILAVPHGQVEAARALGLTPLQTFMDVVLPQSMRVALPALANNLASLVKDSSLAYAISVVELTMVGYRVQAESYQPIPVFITMAAIYLILTTAFTTLTAALEAQLDVGQKR